MKKKIFQKLIIILIVMIITISAPLGSYHIGQQNAYAWNNFEFKQKIWAGMAWALTQTGIMAAQRDMSDILDDHAQDIHEVVTGMPDAAKTIGYFIADRVDTIPEVDKYTYLDDLKASVPELENVEMTQLEASFAQAKDILIDGTVTLRELFLAGLPMTNVMDRYINKEYNLEISNSLFYEGNIYYLGYVTSTRNYYINDLFPSNKNNDFVNQLNIYGNLITQLNGLSNLNSPYGTIYFRDDSSYYKIEVLYDYFQYDGVSNDNYFYSYNGIKKITIYQYVDDSYAILSSTLDVTLAGVTTLINNYTNMQIDTTILDLTDDFINNIHIYLERWVLPASNIGVYNPQLNPDYDRDTNPVPYVLPDINVQMPENNISVDFDPTTGEYNISAITDALGDIETGIDEGNELTGETNTILQGIKDILQGVKSDTGTLVESPTAAGEIELEATPNDLGGFGLFKFLNLILLILINILKYVVAFIVFVISLSSIPSANNLITDPTLIATLNWWKTNKIPVFNLSLMQIITGYLFLMMAIRIFSIIRGWIERRAPNFSVSEVADKGIASIQELKDKNKNDLYNYDSNRGTVYKDLTKAQYRNIKAWDTKYSTHKKQKLSYNEQLKAQDRLYQKAYKESKNKGGR